MKGDISFCMQAYEQTLFEKYSDVITVEELAKMLKIGRNSAYELMRSNQIPRIKIGRQFRVTKQAVIDDITHYDHE